MKKEEQERKKKEKKKKAVLMSTEDSEDDVENWECAGCGDNDEEATNYVGCDRCECWFHFAHTQLVNRATDFVCNFC